MNNRDLNTIAMQWGEKCEEAKHWKHEHAVVLQGLVEANDEIKRLRAEISGYAGQNTNLRNDLVQMGMARDQAIAQVERLSLCLTPLADLAEFVKPEHRDSRPIIWGMETDHAARLTVGHVRCAREALSSTDRTPGGAA